MPVILNSDEVKIFEQGDGVTITTLVDKQVIGEPAMVARRWLLSPGKTSPEYTHGDSEQLMYVISGSGTAQVNGKAWPLEIETMLWLEPGDVYHFIASQEGLEILQGYAPGD